MSKTIITSFMPVTRPEGESIAYNYTVISDTGRKVSDNERGSFIVTNDEIIDKLQEIREFILQNHLEG